MNILVQTIDGIQEILAICPCCGELFRVIEGKFLFPSKPLKSCDYLQLVALEKKLAGDDERLSHAEERFENQMTDQKRRLARKGQKQAKRKLRKIDPVFSARNIDPQDVKVIFDPVEYLIFHGLNSPDGVSLIEFISREPESKQHESTITSIDRTIRNGDVTFETLRLKDDGSFDVHKVN
jgi:predicted Holliday junction resolvase-like endonuclease